MNDYRELEDILRSLHSEYKEGVGEAADALADLRAQRDAARAEAEFITPAMVSAAYDFLNRYDIRDASSLDGDLMRKFIEAILIEGGRRSRSPPDTAGEAKEPPRSPNIGDAGNGGYEFHTGSHYTSR